MLADAGWQARILVRSDPSDLGWGDRSVELVPGSLAQPDSLRALVRGAAAVVHLAGLIKAPRRADYFIANRDGSRALADAVREHAPTAHTILVSSLAAREPALSDYAASKCAAEEVVRSLLGSRLSILRPPAVYGPGDRETLVFFQLAALAWVPLIGQSDARTAVIHVDDLCRALTALLEHPPTAATHAVADSRPDGYSWREIMAAAAGALHLSPRRYFQLPVSLLRSAAVLGDVGALAGRSNMLTSAKLRELRHPRWGVSATELLPIQRAPACYDLQQGFRNAVEFYQAVGWL